MTQKEIFIAAGPPAFSPVLLPKCPRLASADARAIIASILMAWLCFEAADAAARSLAAGPALDVTAVVAAPSGDGHPGAVLVVISGTKAA